MRTASPDAGEWVDGFLFVANRLVLDFLNTKPILADGPTELLPDVHALERWLIASGTATSPKTKSLLRSWRQSLEAEAFRKDLIAFRERDGNPVSACDCLRALGYELQNFVENKLFVFPAIGASANAVRARIFRTLTPNLVMQRGECEQRLQSFALVGWRTNRSIRRGHRWNG